MNLAQMLASGPTLTAGGRARRTLPPELAQAREQQSIEARDRTLSAISDETPMTSGEIAKALGRKTTSHTCAYLPQLEGLGLIKRVGKTKGGYRNPPRVLWLKVKF